jgi:hypothetical protein
MDNDDFWDIALRHDCYDDAIQSQTWIVRKSLRLLQLARFKYFQVPGAHDYLSEKCPDFACSIDVHGSICFCGGMHLPFMEIRDAGVLDIIGGELWEASFYLSAYLLKHPELFLGKNVVELGSGLGLPGFLVAALKATFPVGAGSGTEEWVTCTDNDIDLLRNMKAAGEAIWKKNDSDITFCTHSAVKLSIKFLDWLDNGNEGKGVESSIPCDVIIGSALVYSPDHAAVASVIRSQSCRC